MPIVIPGYEDMTEENRPSFFDYHDNTYNIISRVGYLIGVSKKCFENINDTVDITVFNQLNSNKNARIIRNLCILRTCLETHYNKIYPLMKNDLKNLGSLPEYISQSALAELENDGVSIVKVNYLPMDYLKVINKLIVDRINNVKNVFPDFLNWEYIKDLFIMPDGQSDAGLKAAANEFYENYNSYPYRCYINFPVFNEGNVLYTDAKFVKLLYEYHEDAFDDLSKVTDAGVKTKSEIYNFIDDADKIEIVVDCENSDPFKVHSMLTNLKKEDLIDRICKIILYDDVHTNAAWNFLDEFTKIPVDYIRIERLKDHKSLADIKLSVGVCKEYYENQIDAFILVSSDSDFWALISELPEIKFYVMVESGKVSPDMKKTLENKGYSYCYIDNFNSSESQQLKQRVVLDYLQDYLDGQCNFNIKETVERAYSETRATLSDSEKKQFYDRFIKPMKIVIDKEGEVRIELGK